MAKVRHKSYSPEIKEYAICYARKHPSVGKIINELQNKFEKVIPSVTLLTWLIGAGINLGELRNQQKNQRKNQRKNQNLNTFVSPCIIENIIPMTQEREILSNYSKTEQKYLDLSAICVAQWQWNKIKLFQTSSTLLNPSQCKILWNRVYIVWTTNNSIV